MDITSRATLNRFLAKCNKFLAQYMRYSNQILKMED